MSFDRNSFERFLAEWIKQHADSASAELTNSIYYSVFSGGKRLRSELLVLVSADAGVPAPVAFRLAGAVELAHCFSLVHDDLPEMDNDQFRRGRESTFRRFGHAHALLAGDALYGLSFEMLAEVFEFFPYTAGKILKSFSEAVGPKGMMGGQCLEMDYPADPRVHALKTGALFRISCTLPFLAQGIEDDLASKLGEGIGKYYQWMDDLLDLDQDCDAAKNQFATIADPTDEFRKLISEWQQRYPKSQVGMFLNRMIIAKPA